MKNVLSNMLKFSFIILLSGCGTFGAKLLPKNQQSFNEAASRSVDEQFLLNIVRLHYVDRPFFLRLVSINSQFSFDPSLTLGWSSAHGDTGANVIKHGVEPSFSYRETPTLSYVPLEGRDYTEQVLEPMSVRQMYLLLRSGWSIARILRVCAQNIGAVENALNSSRPISSHAPTYKNFLTLVHYLRKLEREREMTISARRAGKKLILALIFKHRTPPLVNKLLHLAHPQKILYLGQGQVKWSKPLIKMRLRSVLGIMHYLAKSVRTPIVDLEAGRVAKTYDKRGKLFAWAKVTNGMMSIYSSDKYPLGANVKVYYRGHWFYIADNDDDSKQTISLFNQIYALNSNDKTSNGPVLTLPI